jgi:thioredoxin reductase
LKNVIFSDGNKLNFKAVYAALPFTQHSDIPLSLGCELTEHGYIKIDDGQTTVEGVFACGDNIGMRSIAHAVHSGNITGAVVNGTLSDAEF